MNTLNVLLSAVIIGLHTCGFAAAMHAVLRGRTTEGTVAWVIFLIFLPYLAFPLYLIFGHRHFQGYINARRAGDFDINHLSSRVFDSLAKFAINTPFWEPLNRLGCQPATKDNAARLLINGKQTYDAIFEAIEYAQSYVLIQFYIIRSDTTGNRLARHLKLANAKGVDVYVLYDSIGSKGINKKFIRDLKDAGIHCIAFNSSQKNRFQINFRNHRKVTVIDGKVGFIGGHNLGNEYLGDALQLPAWRDTHVQLLGPCVLHLQLSFLTDWYWMTNSIPQFNWYPTTAIPIGQRFESLQASPDTLDFTPVDCLPLASGPSDPSETCALTFLHLIHSAQKRLWIVSPYFVPDQSTTLALELAALRGVDVRVLIPLTSDNPIITLASWAFIQDLMATGVRFFHYTAGMLHQKIILVDHQNCAIGTANFDNRSFRINFEITAVISSDKFVHKSSKMLEQDFNISKEVWPVDLNKSLLFWIIARMAKLLSPVL